MIRTHRPRGYKWAAASEFQQTKLFRDISYEDAEAIGGELLLSDSEDDFPLSDRILKRRRIEKLADDFLNGEELDILSARLDAQAVIYAVSWSLDGPRRVTCGITEAGWDEGSQDSWRDVEDDWEFLNNHCAEAANLAPRNVGLSNTTGLPALEEEVLVEMQQSSCKRRKSQRIAKIYSGPNEDALRKAAELRHRRLRAISEAIVEPFPQSCPKRTIEDSQHRPESIGSTEQDSFSDRGPSPTPAWTSAMWREKGAFKPPRKPRPVPKPVDQDCSRDELGLSSFNIHSQSAQIKLAAKRDAEREKGTQDSQSAATSVPILTADSASLPASDAASQNHDYKSAVSTISEQSSEDYDAGPDYIPDARPIFTASRDIQEDSQGILLKQKGILAKPRRSWVTVNEEQARSPEQNNEHDLRADDEINCSSPTRASILASAGSNACNPRKARTTKSTGVTAAAVTAQPMRRSNRRQSAPDSQKAVEALRDLPADQQRTIDFIRMQYNESVGGKNSSPFVFRKRSSRLDKSYEPDLEPITVQSPPASAVSASKTPGRAITFEPSDTPEPRRDPRTPLTNVHINQLLPQNLASCQHSTSLRSSLRQELIESGAEMSRVTGDKSSQPLSVAPQEAQEELAEGTVIEESFLGANHVEHDVNSVLADANLPQQQPEAQQLWPGTQAMLAQAQHELFTSPDKTNSALYLGTRSTPQAQPQTAGRRRRPLGALSQEPMPSTQALLQDWQGWSSIKKPRQPGPGLGDMPSPTITKAPLDMIASDPVQLFENKAKRRSSLRFSMSFSQDSPAHNTSAKLPSLLARSTDLIPATARTSDAVTWPKPSGKIASSASFGSGLSCLEITAAIPPRPTFLSQNAVSSAVPGARTAVDATTVSLSFGPSQPRPSEEQDIDATPKPVVDTVNTPQSSPQDLSTWRSPQLVDVAETFVPEEESTIIDLSFGPPDVQPNGLGEPLPSYLMMQNAQEMSRCDSQELRSAMNELVEDVLGTATTFSF